MIILLRIITIVITIIYIYIHCIYIYIICTTTYGICNSIRMFTTTTMISGFVQDIPINRFQRHGSQRNLCYDTCGLEYTCSDMQPG